MRYERINIAEMSQIEEEFGDRFRLSFDLDKGQVYMSVRGGGWFGGVKRDVGEDIEHFLIRTAEFVADKARR